MTGWDGYEPVETAREAFNASLGPETAKRFATALIDAHDAGHISPDTFREGLIEIAQNRTGSRNNMGWSVRVEVEVV